MPEVAAAAFGVGRIAGARGKAGAIAWMTAGGGGMHLMLVIPLAARLAEYVTSKLPGMVASARQAKE